ncbi:MAG TPA: carbonic anhydrase [Solirubrobacterales bacterium]|jgi:carbonic anhydrase|nr:carbonic anhydrase [Solirubrobacterales bacterium]
MSTNQNVTAATDSQNVFQDILESNRDYANDHVQLASGVARRGLAIVTCIDSRIDPLAAFGLAPGDAKVVRNAGARVTDDVLRTLVVATHLLGVKRIALVQHTDCGMAANDQAAIVAAVKDRTGESAADVDFLSIDDQTATLHTDAERVRSHKLLPLGITVGEFIFDVRGGKLEQIA